MKPAALHLSLRFDPVLMKADLGTIAPQEWTPHHNAREYGGKWSGVALRSPSGSIEHLASYPANESGFADTPLLGRCVYFRQVLAAFQCPLKSVRLLSLGSRSSVREHVDPGFGAGDSEVRVHVPVQTNSRVEFYLEGRRLLLEEGNCYYIDSSRPHRVVNRSGEDRVHLVIDAEVNDWLRGFLSGGWNVEHLPPSPAGFDAFCRVVLADPDLQRRLNAVVERLAFVDAVVREGRERGFDFDELDVERIGNVVWPSESNRLSPPKEWLPVSVRFDTSNPSARWVHFSRRLTEPFFEDSLKSAMRTPFARVFQFDAPIDLTQTGGAPSGFIFHMSRCGSTLISRMLASLDRSSVVSEAPAIDDVILAGFCESPPGEDQIVECLRAVVSALRPAGRQDLYIVKLDAWHIHKLPLIKRAFPSTPWVFLYRDPLEVLVSQLRSPARFALPGAMNPRILGMCSEDIAGLSREEWCARSLAGFCRSALGFRDEPGGLFLNYERLPEAVWTAVAEHLGVVFTSNDVARMEEAARMDAKSPRVWFQPDSQRKQSEADPVVRNLSEGLLRPLYLQLKDLSAGRAKYPL